GVAEGRGAAVASGGGGLQGHAAATRGAAGAVPARQGEGPGDALRRRRRPGLIRSVVDAISRRSFVVRNPPMRRPGIACVVAARLAGCMAVRPHPAPNVPETKQLVEVRLPGDEQHEVLRVSYRPRNALVLSGGGMNGAYTAGVLKGWTASGERPTFDVVTGISTGALIAPFALLGSEYDDALE